MIISLSGADTFRTREKLHEIRERFRREVDPNGFSISEIEATTAEPEQLRAAILTPSLLSPKRMVIVRDILRAKKDIQDGISTMCEKNDVPAECVLVFVDGPAPAKKKRVKKRGSEQKEVSQSDLATLLQKQKYAQGFPELSPPQAQQWIETRVRERRRTIESSATEQLVATLGVDTWQLANEIEKLIAYTEQTITQEDVEQVTGTRLHEDIFGLVDAIGNRDPAEATRRLAEHLELGVESGLLAGMLIRQIRLLTQAQAVFAEYGPDANLTSTIGVHPFVARKLVNQVQKFSREELGRLYNSLMLLERGLKTSRGTPEILFTQFVASATLAG